MITATKRCRLLKSVTVKKTKLQTIRNVYFFKPQRSHYWHINNFKLQLKAVTNNIYYATVNLSCGGCGGGDVRNKHHGAVS